MQYKRGVVLCVTSLTSYIIKKTTNTLMELKMQRCVVAISTAMVFATVTFTLVKSASTGTYYDLESKGQRNPHTEDITLSETSMNHSFLGSNKNGVEVIQLTNNPEFFDGNCDIVRNHLDLHLAPPNLLVEITNCSSSRHRNLLSGIFMTKLLALSLNGTYTYTCGGGDHTNLLHQLAPILSNGLSTIPDHVNFTDVCTKCASDAGSIEYVHVCPYGLNWAAPIIQHDLQTWAWKHQSEVTDLDDVAIHFRCGDVLTYGSNFMGFAAFDTYTSMLGSKVNPSMRSIGIVTSSLEPSHCRSENCDYDNLDDCHIILQGLVDFLEDYLPDVKVHVRNSVNETLGTAFLRLVLANVTLCPAPSTFCLYPTIASVGQAHILYKAELNPFVEHIDTVTLFPNIHVYKDPILTTDEIKTWKNQTGAAIVEWQHGHNGTYVAAIFHAMYSSVQSSTPTQTPSVHLAVQSSESHTPFISVTEVVCGTHNLRVTCLKLFPRKDDMKYYARVTYDRARS